MIDIAEVLQELGLEPPSVPARCQTLYDEAIRLNDEVGRLETALAEQVRKCADLQSKLDRLLRELPVPPPIPLPPEIVDLQNKVAECKRRIAALNSNLTEAKQRLSRAIVALKQCLAQAAGVLCRRLADLLLALTRLLRLFQKEITGKLEDPRPKDVIMRDIRRCLFGIEWAKRLRRTLGCPALPSRPPRLTRVMREALQDEGIHGWQIK